MLSGNRPAHSSSFEVILLMLYKMLKCTRLGAREHGSCRRRVCDMKSMYARVGEYEQ